MDVSLFIEGLGAHTSQIYTGFGLLEEQGLVRLQFHKSRHYRPLRGIVYAEFSGKKVVYDMGDNPQTILHEYYDTADFYFKRMADPAVIHNHSKVIALGFNYPVYHTNDHFFKRAVTARDKSYILRSFLNNNSRLAALGGIKPFASGAGLQHMQALPNPLLSPQIIFAARLWNNGTADEIKNAERTAINQQRIDIVKKMKQYFKERFIGGIEEDTLSRQQCPELILPKNLFTQKSNYVKHLNKSTIGIATPGLETSVGFKFAEYIAFSKAIVTTPVNTLIPGQFKAGENYLLYNTPDECVAMAEKLLSNKQTTHEMMENNFQYYQQYLRPDKLVWNSIIKACDLTNRNS